MHISVGRAERGIYSYILHVPVCTEMRGYIRAYRHGHISNVVQADVWQLHQALREANQTQQGREDTSQSISSVFIVSNGRSRPAGHQQVTGAMWTTEEKSKEGSLPTWILPTPHCCKDIQKPEKQPSSAGLPPWRKMIMQII